MTLMPQMRPPGVGAWNSRPGDLLRDAVDYVHVGRQGRESARREYGRAQLTIDDSKEGGASDLFTGIPSPCAYGTATATTFECSLIGFAPPGERRTPSSAVENAEKKIYAVDFTPK